MQDAHQNCRIQVLCLFIILALGLVSLPSHSAENASAPLFCESASCPLSPDVTSDGGQEGGPSHGNCPRNFNLHPDTLLPETQGFSGLVPCASFPVLPQAPPIA